MRTLLVLLIGFWVFIGVTFTPIAYALAAACAMLVGADMYSSVQQSRVKRRNRRLDRWCNPVPLPATRANTSKAGRDAKDHNPESTLKPEQSPGRSTHAAVDAGSKSTSTPKRRKDAPTR